MIPFKNLIPILACFLFLYTYGQNKNKKQMKNRPITQMYANAEKLDYKSMPNYYIEGYQSGCYYQIYVNGIMLFKH